MAMTTHVLIGGTNDGRHVAFVRTGCKWGGDATLKFTGAKP